MDEVIGTHNLPQAAADPSVQAAERPFRVRDPEVAHPAGDEPVQFADAVSIDTPQLRRVMIRSRPFSRSTALGASRILTCGPLKKNPNPSSVASAACRIEDFFRFTFSLREPGRIRLLACYSRWPLSSL